MQRFFVPGPLAVGATVQIDALAQQLGQVLRMQAGGEIVLLDGSGQEYHSRIAHLDRRTAAAEILAAAPCRAEPQSHLTLYQCSLKQDKFEWVLQKGTELGASRFVPVISERSVVRPAEALLGKYGRWQAIVREAAEQCGRARVPEIAPPCSWQEAVTGANGLRLLPWEGTQEEPTLHAVLQKELPNQENISILIGPEGGISAPEAHLASAQGWQIVSLGPRILRAETAALAAIALWAGVAGA
ncbi:MAG: 16S rRNA (uracil(1498)-N(3))-methyltransferase [Caldilineaceae bacterium]